VASVSAGYRLLVDGKATPTDCVSDAGAVVAWTLKHIAEYGGDPKKVFVSGSSGGGYLTLMVGMDPKWLSIAALLLMAIPVSLIFRKDHSDMDVFAFIPVPLISIVLPLCLTPILVFPGGKFNGWAILSIFIMIWCSDVGAYLIGSLLGQKADSKKLAPAISPKKSWWGFWGGLAFCVIAALILKLVGVMPYSYLHVVVLGIIVGVMGVCGDLYESMWKRFFNVKDSGNCIPGHGGMYDRFDSSFFALPAATIYLLLTSLI